MDARGNGVRGFGRARRVSCLAGTDRHILFAAALLHDVAKPSFTRNEEGRITSRGHSQRGAIAATRILSELGFNFTPREQVSALVRYHQLPFHLINRPAAQRMAGFSTFGPQTATLDIWLTRPPDPR